MFLAQVVLGGFPCSSVLLLVGGILVDDLACGGTSLARAPVLSPARGSPAGETFDKTPVFDPTAVAPEPAFEFDQTVTW